MIQDDNAQSSGQVRAMLRALIVEDSQDDTFFLLRELKKGGYDVSSVRVETEEAMQFQLETREWDIIFSDYSMPHFSGIEALSLLKKSKKDIPLILVSGAIGEEVAVEAMRSGADDYILKSNMRRLLPAVARTLREARDRQTRREMESALKASEERFTRFAEKALDILFIYRVIDPIGFEYISPSVMYLTGFTPKEFYDHPGLIFEIIHPEDGNILDLFDDIESDIQSRSLNLRIIRKGGGVVWIEVRTVIVKDVAGRITSLEGIARDVTDLRRSQIDLQESEEKFRQVAENIRQVFWIRDFATRKILYISPAYQDLWGKSCESLYKDPFSFLEDIHPGDIEHFRQVFEESLISGVMNEEFRLLLKNGIERWIWARQFPIRDGLGRIVRTAGIAEDITYRKQHERELAAIASISSALSQAELRLQMMPLVLEKVCATLESDCAVVLVHDHQQKCFYVEQGWGGWKNLSQTRLYYQTEPANLLRDDFRKNPQNRNDLKEFIELVHQKGISRSQVVWVDLTAQSTQLGLLVVGRGNENISIPYTEEEKQLLGAMASITANALLRSSLYEQTTLQLKYLTALHEIDLELSRYQSLQDVFSTIVDETSRISGADAVDILVYSAAQQCLVYSAGRGVDQEFSREVKIPLNFRLPGKAAQDKRILYIPDLNQEENLLRIQWIREKRFQSYCAVPLVFKDQVKGVLELFYRRPLVMSAEWENFLQSTAIQAAMAIENTELFEGLRQTNLELQEAYDKTIVGWSRALELRDHETQGHAERVADLTVKLARRFNIEEKKLIYYRWGALLHDIGKMGIPDSILSKPGMLNDPEWEIMRMHPVFGYELLEPIAFLRPALDIPRYHHEKWDGTGYPSGLSGADIPLPARVFALVDVWDALTSHRPYRAAWSKDRALRLITEQSGKHFDPAIVKEFLSIKDSLL